MNIALGELGAKVPFPKGALGTKGHILKGIQTPKDTGTWDFQRYLTLTDFSESSAPIALLKILLGACNRLTMLEVPPCHSKIQHCSNSPCHLPRALVGWCGNLVLQLRYTQFYPLFQSNPIPNPRMSHKSKAINTRSATQ